MAIVDKKGRLFGKINLLDLAVLLLVLAVGGRFGYQYLAKQKAVAEVEAHTIEVTVKLANVQKPTIDQLPVGTELRDAQGATRPRLGKIVKTEVKPAIVRNVGPDGKMWESESKDVFDLYVTISGPGTVEAPVMFGEQGGVNMMIGQAQHLLAPTWKGTGTIWSLNLNPEKR